MWSGSDNVVQVGEWVWSGSDNVVQVGECVWSGSDNVVQVANEREVLVDLVIAPSYGLCSYGLCSYGLCSRGLSNHGLSSYGLSSYGLRSSYRARNRSRSGCTTMFNNFSAHADGERRGLDRIGG